LILVVLFAVLGFYSKGFLLGDLNPENHPINMPMVSTRLLMELGALSSSSLSDVFVTYRAMDAG